MPHSVHAGLACGKRTGASATSNLQLVTTLSLCHVFLIFVTDFVYELHASLESAIGVGLSERYMYSLSVSPCSCTTTRYAVPSSQIISVTLTFYAFSACMQLLWASVLG